jgi:hypothetical protein
MPVTGPPAARPAHADPGGHQARADGQQVEVRTYEGELIRIASPALAKELIRAGLAVDVKRCVRLKLGIRWLPSRLDRPSGRPDLDRMQRQEPSRYGALWRGVLDSHVGKGALGRGLVDGNIRIGPTSGG